MDDEQFDKLINNALDSLPEEFKEMLENVEVTTQDFPTMTQLNKVGNPRILLGLYEGIPKTKRGRYGVGGPLPDKITIFKIPILTISKNKEDLHSNIKDTVAHEIGHHFGLSDKEIFNAMNK